VPEPDGALFFGLRTGMVTSDPAIANRRAISRPRPSLAPVTTASFPSRSGIAISICLRVIVIPSSVPARRQVSMTGLYSSWQSFSPTFRPCLSRACQSSPRWAEGNALNASARAGQHLRCDRAVITEG
jgi:hypothetical protein